ncbi:MAG: ATP-grasp domain-containing protein [Actinomycetota bacterium]|nr:ATP-grasp domain-containing protein [Actinomycetota bacterium]
MGEPLDVAIVGAGPYGLSVAAHLPELRVRVFGRAMDTWVTRMPPQMLLRSAWEETSLSAPGGKGSIDAWSAETGEQREEPIPLAKFLRYAAWFRDRFVPAVDEAQIAHVERRGDGFVLRTNDGREFETRTVVLAVGVTPFAYAPPPFDRHMGPRIRLAIDRPDFERYAGRRVLVVGGGQGGLESAVLAAESGAAVEVILRSRLHWFADREPHHPRGRLGRRLYRIAYPALGYGPPLLNRLPLAPDLLARLPSAVRRRITRRTMRAGGSPWIREVAEQDVVRTEGVSVEAVETNDKAVSLCLSDGSTREVDDVIVAAGFRFDLDRLEFLAPELRQEIALDDGWPTLDPSFRSSARNLFFVGYPAEGRFGPLCRFVLGTEFTAERIAGALGATTPIAVILAGDDHYGSLAGLRALRQAGYEPWLATHRSPTYSTRSRTSAGIIHVPGPRGGDSEFVDAIAEAAVRTNAKVVLPGSEVTLVALAEGRAKLPPGLAVGAPAPEIVARATDKAELTRRVEEAGLLVPPTRELSRGDLESTNPDLTFPAVVKPVRTKTFTARGFHHGRVHRVENRAELERVTKSLPGDRWLVQPYLQGRLAAVAGVAWEGELVCAVHQVALRIAPADTGISAFAVTIPRDEAIEAGIVRLLRGLEWSGLFQAQFINAADGDYLIDFNPRMYGSLALAVAAGLNLPAIWVELLLGRKPEVGDYRVGVRYRAEEKDVRALVRELLTGRRGEALQGLLPRPDTVHAVFSVRDPLPVLTSLAKMRGLRGG